MAPPAATKFKRFVGLEDPQEKSISEEIDECCSLTRKQRLIAFGLCFALGWLISIAAVFEVRKIRKDGPTKFALLYVGGTLIALTATMFLRGPVKQIKAMFDPVRVWATAIFLVAIVLTLVAALVIKSTGLTILAMIFQLLASIWYAASWVPFGRKLIKKFCGKLTGLEGS